MSQRPNFRDIAPPLDVDDGTLRKLADHMDVPVLRKPSEAPVAVVGDQEKPQDVPAAAPRPAATAPSPPAAKKPAPQPDSDRRALEKLSVELPRYLMDAIKQDALNRHTTARHVVMLALQSAGFGVEPADLVPYAPRRKTAKP